MVYHRPWKYHWHQDWLVLNLYENLLSTYNEVMEAICFLYIDPLHLDPRSLRRHCKTWARWTTGALEKFLLFDVSLLEDQIASCVGLYMRECRSLEVLLSAYRNRYMGLVPTNHLYPTYSVWLWKSVHFFPPLLVNVWFGCDHTWLCF